MRVRLTKIKEAENPLHPNNIEEGRIAEGFTENIPTVGERFTIAGFNTWFSTSAVQEIIDENTFRTHNSIYKWQILDKLGRMEIPIKL